MKEDRNERNAGRKTGMLEWREGRMKEGRKERRNGRRKEGSEGEG